MSRPKLPPNFIPDNHLEELLVNAIKNPEARPEFYGELLNSEIFTLGRPAPGHDLPEGHHILDKATKVTVRLLQYKGEPVVPIFSSMKRMMEVIPEEYYTNTGYIGLNCKTLLQMLGFTNKYAINPGDLIVQTLLPHQVEALLDGTIFQKLEDERKAMTQPIAMPFAKDTQFLVGQPKEIPTGLMTKLADYFHSAVGDVEEAFLGKIHVPSSGQPPHPMIVVKLSKNPKRTFDQISIDIAPTINSELGEGKILDLVEFRKVSNLPGFQSHPVLPQVMSLP